MVLARSGVPEADIRSRLMSFGANPAVIDLVLLAVDQCREYLGDLEARQRRWRPAIARAWPRATVARYWHGTHDRIYINASAKRNAPCVAY